MPQIAHRHIYSEFFLLIFGKNAIQFQRANNVNVNEL